MGFLKVVWLEDSSKVTTLLGMEVEMNDVTCEVIEDIKLAMQWDPKLELVSHTCHSRSFHGFCEDVEVIIKRWKTRHPIFVIEHRDYDLVLGQLFLSSVKFSPK